MDLAVGGAKKLYVIMTHTTKEGSPKILKQCTLPLTAPRAVDRIFTDFSVIDVTSKGLVLKEIAPGLTAREVQEATEPPLIMDEGLKEMAF